MSTSFEPAFIINFLLGYFSTLQLNYVTVFNCWNPEDNRHLMGNLSDAGRFVQVVHLDDDDGADLERLVDGLNRRSRTNVGMFLEFGCPQSRELLRKCADAKCFSTSINWLMVDRYPNNSVLEVLKESDLFVDAEIKLLFNDSENGIRLYDAYNNGFSLGGKLNVTFDREVLEHFNGSVTLSASAFGSRSKYQHRDNLADISLKIATLSKEYSLEEAQNGTELEPKEVVATRIGTVLVEALQADLKFKLNYVDLNQMSTDNTSNGILNALEDNVIDLSLFGIMAPEMTPLTCIQPFMAYRSMFIFKTPEKMTLLENIFTRPFERDTWITMLVAILIGTVVMKVSFVAENYLRKVGPTVVQVNPSWIGMLVESFGNFSQQGCEYIPRKLAGRCMQLALFTCSFLAYNYYTAAFFALLIMALPSSNIRNLDQLADGGLQLGIAGTMEARQFFLESHHPDVNHLKLRLLDRNFPWTNPDVGIEQVRQGRYAYHCERIQAYQLIRDRYEFGEVCDLNEVEAMPPQWVGLMIRKDSPFRELFNIRLARMREIGIVKRFVELWITKKPDCLVSRAFASTTLESAFPVILMLIGGLAVALFAFGMESGIFHITGQK